MNVGWRGHSQLKFIHTHIEFPGNFFGAAGMMMMTIMAT
jgi:hypothetical protein